MQSIKIENLKFKILYEESGQSLIEVVIGLAIGAILIGAASFAISQTLQANLSIQKSQTAVTMSQELLERVRAYGLADWQNVYGLTKGSSTQYFLNASGTTYEPVLGKEGVLDNDVTYGLVGEWKFDESEASTSTTTYDSTGNDNSGTLTNSPARASSTCRVANCISFDGLDDYVNIPDNDLLDVGQPAMTISAWVYPRTIGASTYAIVNKNSPYLLWIQGSTRRIQTGLYQGSTWYWSYSATDSLASSTWQHVAMTYDGTSRKIYINGEQSGSTDNQISGSINNGTASINIGRDGCCNRFYLDGLIDDVRVYNRALSADEVKQIYTANVFTRHFYVENACRTNDASSSISGVSPCESITPASSDDPSTQKVTAVTEWLSRATTGRSSLSDYLTRARNVIFQQTDWSGGVSGGTVTSPGATFTTSTNIDSSSGGSIRIEGM